MSPPEDQRREVSRRELLEEAANRIEPGLTDLSDTTTLSGLDDRKVAALLRKLARE